MDGLSGAASVVAIVSIAIQLADGIGKLSNYWNNINDAPADLDSNFLVLGLLSEALAEIRHDGQDIQIDGRLVQALTDCQEAIDELSKIVEGLKSSFDTRKKRLARTWDGAKAVERLKGKQKTLERLRNTFQAAQILYQM